MWQGILSAFALFFLSFSLSAATKTASVTATVTPLKNKTYQAEFSWPVEATASYEISDTQITLTFNKPALLNVATFSKQLAPNFKLVSISKSTSPLKIRLRTNNYYTIKSKRQKKKTWQFIIALDTEKIKRLEEARKKQNAFQKAKEAAHQKKVAATNLAMKPLVKIPTIPIQVTSQKSGTTYQMKWDRPTALASFQTPEGLWFYFSEPAVFKVPQKSPYKISQGKKTHYSWVHVKTKEKLFPKITRVKNVWTLEFTSPLQLTEHPIFVGFSRKEGGPVQGILPVLKPATPIEISQENSLEHLSIVPLKTPSHGLSKTEQFLQFDLLHTHQGVVVKHKTDQLFVSALPEKVTISAHPDLYVSENPKEDDLLEKNFTSLLNFYDWSKSSTPWIELHETLKNAIHKNQGANRIKASVDLARFYLESGMTTEANAILERLQKNNDQFLTNPNFMALYAVGNLIDRRYKKAKTYLHHPLLNEDPEMEVWQGLYLSLQGAWVPAIQKLHYALSYALTYPPQIRHAVILLASEAYIMAGNLGEGERYLSHLKIADLSERQTYYLNYLKGLIEKIKGNIKKAETLWSNSFEKADPFTKTKIGLALIRLNSEKKTLTTQDAIRKLETLKFFWRDDYVEHDILRELSQLYFKAGMYPECFHSTDLLLKYADTPEQQKEAHALLLSLLEQLFLEKITPKTMIKSLALYEKYKNFLKHSKKIIPILEKVIQSYLSLDLVDRALVVMTNIRTHLKPIDLFDNTLQQATLLVMNGQPQKAINLLLPLKAETEEARTLRRHSLARAYLKDEETTKALDVLKNDDSPEAHLIKTLVYRTEKNWFLAAEGFKKLAEGAKDRKTKADLLAQAVIAYTLAGKKLELKTVYQKNSVVMKTSNHADFFKLMKQSQFDPKLNQASFALMFNAFMVKYEENMKRLISL